MSETKLNAIDICWFERLLPTTILIVISVWGEPDDENEDQKRIKIVVKRILFAIRLYDCYCNNHCSASDHDTCSNIVVQNSTFQTDHNLNYKKYSSKKSMIQCTNSFGCVTAIEGIHQKMQRQKVKSSVCQASLTESKGIQQ